MRLAYRKQNFQDWFTQQWTILWSRRIDPVSTPWLMGPFGNMDAIADDFIEKLAIDENLIITRNVKSGGLLDDIGDLNLSREAVNRLSQEVIDFYENTASYKLDFKVRWNPFFKFFGMLLNQLFSNRIEQLNIPTRNETSLQAVNSEIITLSELVSKEVKYKVWFRTFQSTGKVLYSGIYTTCKIPNGDVCIKAIFPLPRGNATVIMKPIVEANGALRLESSGEKFGDPGFYFLLNDSKGKYWSQYVSSFRDSLVVWSQAGRLYAEQTLSFWHMRVLRFYYEMNAQK